MEKKYDLISLLKACNYDECRVFVADIDESVAEELHEIGAKSELYDMLSKPDSAGVDYIHTNYCHVEWNFYDREVFQLRIEYGVDDDSLHFRYDRFNLKTKYTLINILKSQSEWHHIGIAMYDNETEEIVADSWFDADETESDTWIHAFEDLCDEWEVNSRHASLFKGQEEEDGKTVDILDIVIDTETYKLEDNNTKKECGSLYCPISFIRDELAKVENEYAGLKVMCWDNNEGDTYYICRVEGEEDEDVIYLDTAYESSQALDVTSLMELLLKYDDDKKVCFTTPEEDVCMEFDCTPPFFYKIFEKGEDVIVCYSEVDDDEDDAEDEDEELKIESREEMVGVPLAGIPFYDFDLRITPEEAEMLDGEIEVAFYTGGPYFSSRDASTKWTGALNVDNLTLNLYNPLYEYHDALYRLWEKKNYGHDFKDFVIEVFDMKIKKGKVAILIELGS